jgi:predicted enzyme related to lactoylglutathione lyase
MTITALGLRTVIYPAPDLEASKAWFSALFGATPTFDSAFYVGFDVGGYELGLRPDLAPADGALTYWGVDDVAAAVSAALDAGASVHEKAQDVGDGIVVASVRTPQGVVIGFIHNPHFVAR